MTPTGKLKQDVYWLEREVISDVVIMVMSQTFHRFRDTSVMSVMSASMILFLGVLTKVSSWRCFGDYDYDHDVVSGNQTLTRFNPSSPHVHLMTKFSPLSDVATMRGMCI